MRGRNNESCCIELLDAFNTDFQRRGASPVVIFLLHARYQLVGRRWLKYEKTVVDKRIDV